MGFYVSGAYLEFDKRKEPLVMGGTFSCSTQQRENLAEAPKQVANLHFEIFVKSVSGGAVTQRTL